jgi:hypothetical protein
VAAGSLVRGLLAALPLKLVHDTGHVGLVWREATPGPALAAVLQAFVDASKAAPSSGLEMTAQACGPAHRNAAAWRPRNCSPTETVRGRSSRSGAIERIRRVLHVSSRPMHQQLIAVFARRKP